MIYFNVRANKQTKSEIVSVRVPLISDLFYKSFFLCIMLLVFFTPFVKAEGNPNISELSGTWEFKNVEFAVYKYGDLTPLKTERINNVADLEDKGFPFENVFRELSVSGGQILCKLGNQFGDNLYFLQNDGALILIDNKEKEGAEERAMEGRSLFIPPYTIVELGNELQITTVYSYGTSEYDFPLEGKLQITMVKK